MKDSRFIRFIIVGISNALISFITFEVTIKLLNNFVAKGTAAQSISYTAGIIWSYTFNRKWTFKSSNKVGPEVIRFIVVQLSLLLLSSVTVGIAVDGIDLPYRLSWATIMFFITILNYFLMKKLVYRSAVAKG